MFGLFGAGIATAQSKREKAAAETRRRSKRKGHPMRAVLSVFPLLAIPVIIYNLMAFMGGAPAASATAGAANISALAVNLNATLIAVPMISGVTWELTGADCLILLTILLLFLEILKSTGTGTATIMNHAVSMILFIVCLVEFLMFPNFATSAFFIIMVMTLLDVLAGVVVTIVSARRDFAVGEGFA